MCLSEAQDHPFSFDLDPLDHFRLRELARGYFERKEFKIRETVTVLGTYGAYEFDFILSQPPDQDPDVSVIVKDWARNCGSNVVLQFEQILQDLQLTNQQGMLIGNKFSLSARAAAETAGLLLLSREELVAFYRTNNIQLEFGTPPSMPDTL
jgi:hypothetical protein